MLTVSKPQPSHLFLYLFFFFIFFLSLLLFFSILVSSTSPHQYFKDGAILLLPARRKATLINLPASITDKMNLVLLPIITLEMIILVRIRKPQTSVKFLKKKTLIKLSLLMMMTEFYHPQKTNASHTKYKPSDSTNSMSHPDPEAPVPTPKNPFNVNPRILGIHP